MADLLLQPLWLGVTLPMLDPEQSLATMALLAGSTVKSVEIWEPYFPYSTLSTGQVRQVLADGGVEPRSIHTAFGQKLDISSLDPAVRAAGMQALTRGLDLAVQLGAQIVVVHPSSEPIDDEQRLARLAVAKESIAAFASAAQQAGRQVAIELLPRTCLGRTAEELLHLVAGVDPQAAGICLDTNHLMGRYAELPTVVRALKGRLITLHCSDYDGVDEKHWPLLRGVIDWQAFIVALREIGFEGPLHYEAFLDGETPAARLASLQENYARVMAQFAA